ncbi:hypothetical protein BDV96DRAFT_652401 [Lophiotrema nucula]|uniref:Uncharacterized protein n=1 Tax=Lophiotrema nucula TaxID=690887 RepID=A0A6A5YRS7_9PLEO|nr:hypothetical protein BDV96DRAFT_652401 [Lophiotrema nucula]
MAPIPVPKHISRYLSHRYVARRIATSTLVATSAIDLQKWQDTIRYLVTRKESKEIKVGPLPLAVVIVLGFFSLFLLTLPFVVVYFCCVQPYRNKKALAKQEEVLEAQKEVVEMQVRHFVGDSGRRLWREAPMERQVKRQWKEAPRNFSRAHPASPKKLTKEIPRVEFAM